MCGGCPGLSVDQDGIFLGIKYRNVFLIYGKDKHETSRASASPQSYQWGLQSVSKVMTHLTVFGEFSSIPNLGKTSPPPPCTMLTRHEMTIVPERVINIDWGGGGKFGKRYFF